MSLLSIRTTIAALTIAALVTVQAQPSAAAPAGWDGPTAVPGTSGAAEPFFATAPDGTDAVAWVAQEGPGDIEIRARIRPPGTDEWRPVPVRVDGRPSVQNLSMAAAPHGDFWLSWVQYAAHPSVWAMRLDTRSRSWTRPFRVFDQPGYEHTTPKAVVAGNGTVLIAATAQPKEFTSPPVARVTVATLQRGRWATRFLSEAGGSAVNPSVAANGKGRLLVAFVKGDALSTRTVHAAVRGSGSSASWDVQPVSEPGDGQTVVAALGETGRAAVAWPAPAESATGVRMATTPTAAADWTRHTLVSDTTLIDNPRVAVAADGAVLTAWSEDSAGDVVIQSRFLSGGLLYPQVQLSPTDVTGRPAALLARPGGDVALLYEELTSGTSTTQGLRLVTVDGAFPGAPAALTSNSDGTPQHESLGVTAASRLTALWRRGSPPTSDVATVDQSLRRPDVMSGPATGDHITRSRVAGVPRVGRTVTCVSGYWVEAGRLDHRWFRDGDRIRAADGRRYRVAAVDAGTRLSCRTSATNASGQTRTLDSPARRVR